MSSGRLLSLFFLEPSLSGLGRLLALLSGPRPPSAPAWVLTWSHGHSQGDKEQQCCVHLGVSLEEVGAPPSQRPYNRGGGRDVVLPTATPQPSARCWALQDVGRDTLLDSPLSSPPPHSPRLSLPPVTPVQGDPSWVWGSPCAHGCAQVLLTLPVGLGEAPGSAYGCGRGQTADGRGVVWGSALGPAALPLPSAAVTRPCPGLWE